MILFKNFQAKNIWAKTNTIVNKLADCSVSNLKGWNSGVIVKSWRSMCKILIRSEILICCNLFLLYCMNYEQNAIRASKATPADQSSITLFIDRFPDYNVYVKALRIK